MNLLIINLDKGIFASKSASLERLKEYSRLADRIFVIVWTTKKEEPIVWRDRLFVLPTNSCCRFFYYVDSFKMARKIMRDCAIDLIFTQDPFETGFCGWLFARNKKIKLQIQVHTDFLSPYFSRESISNKLRVSLAKFLLPKADSIRVVSGRISEELKSKIRGLKTEPVVLPIFVDVEKIKAAPIKVDLKQKYPQFDFIILMASRLSPEKNIGLAVGAMAEIIKKQPKAGLIIVGDGKEKSRLERLVKSRNLQSNIIFEPRTDDLPSYGKSADLFLLASNYEGWGMAVVEAMASGCPVVMTDVGCAGELIINGENGMVVPVNDKSALVQALLEIIKNPVLRHKIAQNGICITQKMPTKERYLKTYKESWEKALN